MIEGESAGRVTGLGDQRVEIAMMRTPDGNGRLELSRFRAPPVIADHRNAPLEYAGCLRVMFAVDDLDDTLAPARQRRRATRRTKWSRVLETSIGSALSAGRRASSSGSPEQIG